MTLSPLLALLASLFHRQFANRFVSCPSLSHKISSPPSVLLATLFPAFSGGVLLPPDEKKRRYEARR